MSVGFSIHDINFQFFEKLFGTISAQNAHHCQRFAEGTLLALDNHHHVDTEQSRQFVAFCVARQDISHAN